MSSEYKVKMAVQTPESYYKRCKRFGPEKAFQHDECLCKIKLEEHLKGAPADWPFSNFDGTLYCCLCGSTYSNRGIQYWKSVFSDLKHLHSDVTDLDTIHDIDIIVNTCRKKIQQR